MTWSFAGHVRAARKGIRQSASPAAASHTRRSESASCSGASGGADGPLCRDRSLEGAIQPCRCLRTPRPVQRAMIIQPITHVSTPQCLEESHPGHVSPAPAYARLPHAICLARYRIHDTHCAGRSRSTRTGSWRIATDAMTVNGNVSAAANLVNSSRHILTVDSGANKRPARQPCATQGLNCAAIPHPVGSTRMLSVDELDS